MAGRNRSSMPRCPLAKRALDLDNLEDVAKRGKVARVPGVDKLEIYRRLGVGEVWIWKKGKLDVCAA
jgi:hypothetical protein